MSVPGCCSNPPILDASSGAGHVQNFGGLDSYLTGSPHSNRAILFVTDVFGYEAPLLRELADKVANAGYYVVVPDFYHGDPYDPNNTSRPLDVWVEDHDPYKGFEAAKPIIETLKYGGASFVGAAGFCWGAKTVTDLGNSKLIQAAVLCHPAYITVDDFFGFDIPIAILGAEFDTSAPPQIIKQFAEVLAAKPEVDSYVKIFPNVSHGWTLRYDINDPEAVKAAEEAHLILLEWFDKHLKGFDYLL